MVRTVSRTRKSLKGEKNGDPLDRISNLPDEILCQILSLVTTKDAVNTTILSRRWKNLWASVTTLHFSELLFYYDGKKDRERLSIDPNVFKNFVDKVLTLRDNNVIIHKFILEECLFIDDFDDQHIDEWILAAVKGKVEHLSLRMNGNTLPPNLCGCKTLTTLKLEKVLIDMEFANPEGVFFLPSLKTLYLIHVEFLGDDSASEIISSCPVLEDLYIWRYGDDGVKTLSIYARRLKRLTLKCWRNFSARGFMYKANFFSPVGLNWWRNNNAQGVMYKVWVYAPSLRYLNIEDMLSDEIVVKSGKLFKARVELQRRRESSIPWGEYRSNMIQLFRGISNVKRLWLGFAAMNCLRDESDIDVLRFQRLTNLKLSFGSYAYTLFPKLLEGAPNLKHLALDMVHCPRDLHFKEYRRLKHSVPNCLLFRLHYVNIRISNMRLSYMDLFMYLLENARVLKKMKIYGLPSLKHSKLLEELSTFPRASKTCQVHLREATE